MAIIKMINGKSKQSLYGMNKFIDYVKKLKNEGGLIEGVNCNAETAFEQFCLTKEGFNKIDGRLYIHMEQSFPKDINMPVELSLEIGKQLISELPEIFEGFQIVIGVHDDKEHIHNHFAINSVNSITGKKWNLSKYDKRLITEKSLELCDRYAVKIWWDKSRFPDDKIDTLDKEKLNTVKNGEWQKQQEGKSWKYELFLSITACLKTSYSKEDFIKNMNELNYQVQWDHHKYIVFTTPDGKKCRNNKLYPVEKFTKENLEKIFERNRNRSEREKEKYRESDEIPHLKNIIKAFYSGTANKSSQSIDAGLPITSFKRKKLEGQALKDVAIKKSNAGYNWDNEFDM